MNGDRSFVILLSSLLSIGWAQEVRADRELRARIRDSSTGEAVVATIDVYQGPSEGELVTRGARVVTTRSAGSDGWLSLRLEPGSYLLEVSGGGYQSLRARFTAGGHETELVVLWLDPLEPRDYLRPERIWQQLESGMGLFHGHVVDSASGRAVARVRVALADSVGESVTDERGYFTLPYTVPWTPPGALPETTDLELEAPGYRSLRLRGVLLLEGDTHYLLELSPGEGVIEREAGHRFFLPPVPTFAPLIVGQPPSEPLAGTAVVEPPGSVRVGFADAGCSSTCCTGSCPVTCVFSFEHYVRRGLNDEWISSWGPPSLSSGAVPYRSYGAWHTQNPATAGYDICSSACCQVNDADTSIATDSAVNLTGGIMLTGDGSPFRSEYSAQNNAWDDPNDGLSCSNSDLSCGDGFVGSPTLGWPCLEDLVGLGLGCFGHGRGMSQWGTFFWEDQQQRSWKWMVNHYYNGNGNPTGLRSSFLTSPIEIGAVSADPAVVDRGSNFQIDLEATNHAAIPHGQVLIGASLFSPATGYLSDPTNDAKVTLEPGVGAVFRLFAISPETPDGLYDLVVALWLDIDQDGAIGTQDLVLDQVALTDAVEVASVAKIFTDGFESGDTSAWSIAVSPP
jgi:hypothetical protein